MSPKWLMVGVLLLAPTAAHADGTRCPQESTLRSINGNVSTELTFINQTGQPIRIYWLNYQGMRQFYAELLPGQQHEQQTFVTHPWVVTNNSEDCLGVYLPDPQPRNIVIR